MRDLKMDMWKIEAEITFERKEVEDPTFSMTHDSDMALTT
jgi:hypothetical protein